MIVAFVIWLMVMGSTVWVVGCSIMAHRAYDRGQNWSGANKTTEMVLWIMAAIALPTLILALFIGALVMWAQANPG